MARAQISHQKTRRQRKRQRIKFFSSTAFFIALCFGFYYFMNAEFTQHNELQFKGLWLVNEEEIRSDIDEYLDQTIFGFIPRRNIFVFSPGKLREHIKESYSRIEKIEIDADKGLTISVSERKINALWCQLYTELAEQKTQKDEFCLSLNESALAYAQAPLFSNFIFKKFFTLDPVEKGKNFMTKGDYIAFQNFLNYIEEDFDLDIEKIEFKAFGDVDIFVSRLSRSYYKEGQFKLMYSSQKSYSETIEALQSALGHSQFKKDFRAKSKDLLYVDARFSNQVSYKFKELEEEK